MATPKLPDPGSYAEVAEERWFVGGEAINTAIALRGWGAPVRLVGNAIADDEPGRFLRTQLTNAGFADALLADAPDFPTPVCDIYVTPDGKRTMFGHNFSALRRESLPAVSLESVSWFTADSNPDRLAADACLRAAEAGVKVLAMDFYRHPDVAQAAEIWLCSTDWVGHAGDIPGLLAWAASFAAKHRTTTVVTDGANGSVSALATGEAKHHPAFPADTIVDTTGCGDVFRAGLLYGLWKGWEFDQCIRFASAAGCLNAQELGATAGVHSLEHTVDFMSKR